MTTTSRLSEQDLEIVQPDEDIMFERENRGRTGLRKEVVNEINRVGATDKYVKKGDASFVHPDSDAPTNPTSVNEVLGNVDIITEVGGQEKLFRVTNGISVNLEDELADSDLAERKDAVLELFDYGADVNFFNGVTDRNGNTLRKGFFQWLQDNMDKSTQIIDGNNISVGKPANVILEEAYSKTTGTYVDNTWDLAIAEHEVWAKWNSIQDNSGAGVMSEWDLVDADSAGVGVNRRMTLPENIAMRSPPSMSSAISQSISLPSLHNTDAGGGKDDVMWLIPDHNGELFELYEMGAPETREVDQEGFRQRVEYMWKFGTVFDNSFRNDSTNPAEDVIKIENVSQLF